MYNKFENKIIQGKEASRYIAAWVTAGGELYPYGNFDKFDKWLESLGLTKLERRYVHNIAAMSGKELRDSAKEFLKENEE